MGKKKSLSINFLGKKYVRQEFYAGILFVLPVLILGIVFIILPMLISLGYSFTDANLLKLNEVNFVAFQQFERAFSDPVLKKAFGNTMIFVGTVVPIQLIVALLLALILNTKIKLNTFFRWAFFVPVMLSLATTSMLWINLLNEDSGLINTILLQLGFEKQTLLTDPSTALLTLVVISAWQGAGYQMLIILSGLQNVPRDLYEAAEMDGADAFNRFRYITVPSIKPTLSFVLITTLIGAFRIFTQPFIMTKGGPIDSTMTMSLLIYQQGINFRNVGYSSAIALIYTIFMATIALTLRKITDKDNTV